MTPNEVINILKEGRYPGYFDEIAAADCVEKLTKENELLKEEIKQLKSKVQYWKAREK